MSETTDVPLVHIDDRGIVTSINHAFELALGWTKQEITGQPLSVIVPPHLREAHNKGFARFMASEQPKIIGRPMRLPTLHKSGAVFDAEHTISAEKTGGRWSLQATIKPLA